MATVPFPLHGIDKGRNIPEQPEHTSPAMNNMRSYDVLGNRMRGGQRPGLAKLYTQQIASLAGPVVAICSITVISQVD